MLEDDEIAMRSHAAYVHSNTKFHPQQSERESMDDESADVNKKHGIAHSYERRDSSDDMGEYGGYGPGQITKTVSYTVRDGDQHEGR